jgi:hypothetical protein
MAQSDTTKCTRLDAIERLKECSHLRWIIPHESWNSRRHDAPKELSTSYGDWKELTQTDEVTPETFVLVEYATGGDYANTCLVEVANHRVIEELCVAAGLRPDRPGER